MVIATIDMATKQDATKERGWLWVALAAALAGCGGQATPADAGAGDAGADVAAESDIGDAGEAGKADSAAGHQTCVVDGAAYACMSDPWVWWDDGGPAGGIPCVGTFCPAGNVCWVLDGGASGWCGP